jgi:sterol desaturase/sphingolipid hydroxylase (fatty acid hydroxylase superfamily)
MPALDPSSQRIRLFRNGWLEKLTLISPQTFAFTWGLLLPLIAWVGWGAADPLAALALVVGGLLSWTLFEYATHRYLFHLDVDRPALKALVFLIHGNHHDNPGDPLRDLMPLLVSLPVSALIWSICVALLGAPGTWLFLGYITGYVIYDGIHYACHHGSMRGKLASAIKRHHMRHHHVDDTANYAISAIFWDRVFGTGITSLKR